MNGAPDPDYLVTVCDVCGTASCWHGEMMCDSGEDGTEITPEDDHELAGWLSREIEESEVDDGQDRIVRASWVGR